MIDIAGNKVIIVMIKSAEENLWGDLLLSCVKKVTVERDWCR